MKTIRTLLIIICMILFVTSSYAKTTSTVTITLVNHTKETFTYTGTSTPDPKNNTFSIMAQTLKPQSYTYVFGTTTELSDLNGVAHFVDSTGKKYHLSIHDKLMFHTGQPTFIFSDDNGKTISSPPTLTFHTGGTPRSLSYIGAIVDVYSSHPL